MRSRSDPSPTSGNRGGGRRNRRDGSLLVFGHALVLGLLSRRSFGPRLTPQHRGQAFSLLRIPPCLGFRNPGTHTTCAMRNSLLMLYIRVEARARGSGRARGAPRPACTTFDRMPRSQSGSGVRGASPVCTTFGRMPRSPRNVVPAGRVANLVGLREQSPKLPRSSQERKTSTLRLACGRRPIPSARIAANGAAEPSY